MNPLAQRILRTLIFYVAMLVIVRIMGKREMDSLSPFDLVVAIMVGEMATIAVENLDIPVSGILIPMFSLAVAELLVSFVLLKSDRLRSVIDGSPTLLVKSGVILEKNMVAIRYNLTDLLAQLRLAGYPNVEDVEVAILETNGKLSVFPRSKETSPLPRDLELPQRFQGLLVPLVRDGRVISRNLAEAGLSEAWLEERLKEHGLDGPKDAFLATIDGDGRFFVQKRANRSGDVPS